MSSNSQLVPLDMSFFGDASDGDVTISIDTALTRTMWYNNLTINSGVVLSPDGYKIHCRGILTINGTIRRNGNNGNNAVDSNSQAGGALATSIGRDLGANRGGSVSGTGQTGAGGNSAAGTSNTVPFVGGTGGVGGNGGAAASAGGVASLVPDYGRIIKYPIGDVLLFCGTGATAAAIPIQGGGGGTGGAGGGGSGGGNQGGGGGSGGAGGCPIAIFARNIIISATGAIESKGGNGGNGAAGQTGNSGGGGGGGSGGGGFVYLLYLTLANSGSISVAIGTPGTPGAGRGTGNPGIIGNAGVVGTIVKFNALTGRIE